MCTKRRKFQIVSTLPLDTLGPRAKLQPIT
ncbi:hypothetical protein RUA4292_00162 [Ruegeria atlantica]|uniref:Uncharacterized protein n=1 Tax=Ruegeria atlantica TaxID=81569 RepID=A0A0P1E9Q3_9RHOB|nr:hypothetical protein RUA4292_00162 [Ruegeria atlantica]